MTWRRLGYFFLVAPFFLAPSLWLSLQVLRDVVGGTVLVSAALVAATLTAR